MTCINFLCFLLHLLVIKPGQCALRQPRLTEAIRSMTELFSFEVQALVISVLQHAVHHPVVHSRYSHTR